LFRLFANTRFSTSSLSSLHFKAPSQNHVDRSPEEKVGAHLQDDANHGEGKKNGQVLERDFVHWGELVAEISKIPFTDEIRKHWEKAYSIYFSNNAGESAEKWIKSVEEFGKTPNVIQICTELNMAVFTCADANKDGVVSFDEFKAFVSVLGVTDQDDVKFAFKMIDENKDGVLSKEELGKACAHYYMDAEDTPYKHFYGKFEG
jgi:Ca2+-binding EF-hand superfamily protein